MAVLAMAAVSAELRAILLYKMCKNSCAALLIPLTMANSAQNSARTESQNSDIPT